MTRSTPATEEGVLTEVRQRTKAPPRYKVILHNDDFTTMEFVVDVLVRHFHRSKTDAMRIMLEVHMKGAGVAGVFTRDQAETKVALVTAEAEREGFPLLVTMEPE